MSEVWELLAKNALDDKETMKTTYKAGSYGISAYHCQQCLEKIIKAVILKNNFSKNDAKHLGHRPLSNTWNEFVKKCVENIEKRRENTKKRGEEMKEWEEDIQKLEMYSVLVSLRDASEHFFDYVERLAPQVMEKKKPNDLFKKLWWKWSLDIPFIGNEKNQWDAIFQPYKENLASHVHGESHVGSLQQNIKSKKQHATTKNVKTAMQHQHGNCCISFCMVMFKQFKNNYLNNQHLISQSSDIMPETFGSFILLMPIHNCVFPHEDIGRYDQIVDGKSTTEWYDIKRVELELLEKHVGEIFDFIKKHL